MTDANGVLSASYDSVNKAIRVSTTGGGGNTSITYDTLANRPAAGNAGVYYLTSDTYVLYRDSGTVWVAVVPGLNGSGVVPTGELGSGTANSTTFLRGDSTWATVATALSALSDVNLASLANGDLLQYQTSDSRWHNVTGIDGSKITTGTVAVGRLPTGTGSSNVVTGGTITGAGPQGDAAHTQVITFNDAGQLTAVSSVAISGSGIDTSAVHTSDYPITANHGGTGATTLAAHGVVIGNGTGVVNVTGTGTANQVLTSNGASADPTFQSVSTSNIDGGPVIQYLARQYFK